MATDNPALSALAQERMNLLFEQWNERQGVRPGLHASSVVAYDNVFCYRELVLARFYMPVLADHSVWTLRTFLNGWHVHIKWQKLFVDQGIAEKVETTEYAPAWQLHFTPDAIINLFGTRTIVEIKSMKTTLFQALGAEPPENAVRQAQLYMHLLGITQALILVENKDNQDIRTWVIPYDFEQARPFVKRLNTLVQLWQAHADPSDKRLPKRICERANTVRAKKCPLRDMCFADQATRDLHRIATDEGGVGVAVTPTVDE